MMNHVLSDVRYALRGWVRQPGFVADRGAVARLRHRAEHRRLQHHQHDLPARDSWGSRGGPGGHDRRRACPSPRCRRCATRFPVWVTWRRGSRSAPTSRPVTWYAAAPFRSSPTITSRPSASCPPEAASSRPSAERVPRRLQRGGARLRVLGQGSRGPSGHHRPDTRHQPGAGDDHRRRAEVVPRLRARAAAAVDADGSAPGDSRRGGQVGRSRRVRLADRRPARRTVSQSVS